MADDNDVFAAELEANGRYSDGFELGGLDPRAARGLAVLTCMDSRIEPLAMLGLRPGDAKILRNAGARVTDDVLRTLVLASYLLGVDRAMIVAHTRCRMAAGDEEDVHAAIEAAGGPDTRSLSFLVTDRPGGGAPRGRPARALLALPDAARGRRLHLRRRHRPTRADLLITENAVSEPRASRSLCGRALRSCRSR